jgi:hypothetical protein
MQNIIRTIVLREISWKQYVTRKGGKETVYKISVGKAEGTKPLGNGQALKKQFMKYRNTF